MNQALLLARYLIEDAPEDKVTLSLNAKNQTVMIRTYFKKLIGKYSFYDPSTENKLTGEICFVLKSYFCKISFLSTWLFR